MDHWAKLVSLNGISEIDLNSDNFTIGRSRKNNLCLKQNGFISSEHCSIMRDPSGIVWLVDNSSNGTIINNSVKVHKNQSELKHGDVIYLVNNNTDQNVAYRLELTSELNLDEDNSDTDVEEDITTEQQTLPIEINVEFVDSNDVECSSQEPVTKRKRMSTPPLLEPEEKEVKSAKEKLIKSYSGEISAMEENLECSICREIMHNCVCIQPCLHSFCAHCLLDWRKQSRDCPTCRKSIKGVSKNHLVNNLLEVFLSKNPDKKLSEDEIKEIDQRVNEHSHTLFESSSNSSAFTGNPRLLGPPTVQQLQSQPQSCRLCNWSITPYPWINRNTVNNPITVGATNFMCAPHQQHIFCMCCHRPMPDRRGEPNAPAQSCNLCGRLYCHLLWTCQEPRCSGCLNKFNEHLLDAQMPNTFLLDNATETQILQDYLTTQSISFPDMLTDCFTRLDSGEFSLSQSQLITSSTIVCYGCGLKHLKELVYQYRSAIPNTDLPPEVTAKEDCHYGRNCRTQYSRSPHQHRFNHICQQVRFQ